MPLNIHKASQDDILALCSLMEELSGNKISLEQMTNRLRFVDNSKFDSLFVCEENGKVVGLLGFRIRENLEEVSKFGEISAIVVNSDNRRRGVGRFMMNYAEKLAKDQGCKGTWLVSGFGREKQAHKFYKKLS